MEFKTYRSILFLALTLVLILSTNAAYSHNNLLDNQPTAVRQNSAWYIVMYDASADVLYWLDENGEQASMNRPILPNETAPSNPRLLLSPNGRILVIAAPLANGQEGLGFYDLETKSFIQNHIAQPNEGIILGGQHSINATSTRMAVGFVTPPNANSSAFSWRVLQFDLTSGNLVDELRSDGQEIQRFVGGEFFTNSIYAPYVVFYHTAEVTGDEEIHIQFIIWGEPPFERPSLGWFPQGVPGVGQELVTSPYGLAGIDFDLVTGEAVFVQEDPNYPNLGGTGLYRNYNSVARGVPDGFGNYPDPVVLHVDGNSYFYGSRWAANGSMVLMEIGNLQQNEQWYYMRMGGGPVLVGPNTVDVIGLPIGFAWVDNTGKVGVHSADGVLHNENLWQAPSQFPRFLWASIGMIPFGLSSVTGTTNEGVDIGGAIDTVHCVGAPPSQVSLGILARVTFTDGRALNVRTEPNGTVMLQLEEGTPFNIVSGPLCGGNFTWWEIRLANQSTGWVAEGDAQNYYIEPQSGGGNDVGAPGARG